MMKEQDMKITIPRIAIIAIMAPFLFGFVPEAHPATILKVPLNFDSGLVRDSLLQQVFKEPDEQCTIYDEDGGCSRFILAKPSVDVQMRCLKITMQGMAYLGEAKNGACMGSLDWKGFVEISAEPWLDPATSSLALKITGYRLLDENHNMDHPNLKLYSIVKTNLYPRIEAHRVDFSSQMTELRSLLLTMLPGRPDDAKALADSLTVKKLKMSPDGRGVLIEVRVPPTFARPTQDERIAKMWQQQKQRRLESWDAFLTFAIKRMARRNAGPEREKILAALLDARYAIAEVQFSVDAGDREQLPVLFTRTWDQVRSAAMEVNAGMQPGKVLQGATSFVTTADAALSLSEEGKDSGIELSDASLRIISRKLDPQATEDPVSYSTDIDPELRTLLGFGDPLPAPSIPPDVDASMSAQSASLSNFSAWLSVREAQAETNAYVKLRSWAPEEKDIDTYLPLVRQLMNDLANEALAKKNLGPQYHALYRDLVLTTAWQESCCRQFIRKNNKPAALMSSNGSSVGIMQINSKVWRGIYDPAGLSGDIVYNGRAGSEILLHYLCDYALAKKEHLQPGGADNLARATYAVYNGGPAQLARYRKPDTKPLLKKIDALWWNRYTAVREGRIMDVAECFK